MATTRQETRESPEEQRNDEAARQAALLFVEKSEEYANNWKLLINKEFLRKNFPDHAKLRELDDDDRRSVLRFIGRLSASLETGFYFALRRNEWMLMLAKECEDIVSDATEPEKIREVLNGLLEIAALRVAGEINTNTSGSSVGEQEKLNNALLDELLAKGEHLEANTLTNPYGLEEGMTYFVPAWNDAERRVQLNERRLGEVVLDGKDSVVDEEGKTISLFDINREFARGARILKDGSNFLGGYESPQEIAALAQGERITLRINVPLAQDLKYNGIFLGTNRAELEEKYGRAYLPHAKELLNLKVNIEGRESEVRYRDVVVEKYSEET